MKITVAGVGYVGLLLAVLLAQNHEVTAITTTLAKAEKLNKHLQKVKVHKGDMFYFPAGTVHGIGGGILVAEIQESSNVTYRVYDYNRVDKNGNKRELHFDKAVQVMDMGVAPEAKQRTRMVKYYVGCSRDCCADVNTSRRSVFR